MPARDHETRTGRHVRERGRLLGHHKTRERRVKRRHVDDAHGAHEPRDAVLDHEGGLAGPAGDHGIEHRQPPRRCGEVGDDDRVRWSGVVVVVVFPPVLLNKNTSPRPKPDKKAEQQHAEQRAVLLADLPLPPIESYIIFVSHMNVQRVHVVVPARCCGLHVAPRHARRGALAAH